MIISRVKGLRKRLRNGQSLKTKRRLKVARPNWKASHRLPVAGSSVETKGSSSFLAAVDASTTSLSVPTALIFLASIFAFSGELPLDSSSDSSGGCSGASPWGWGLPRLLMLGDSGKGACTTGTLTGGEGAIGGIGGTTAPPPICDWVGRWGGLRSRSWGDLSSGEFSGELCRELLVDMTEGGLL